MIRLKKYCLTPRLLFGLVCFSLLVVMLALQLLPLPQTLTRTPYATMLLDRDGQLLGASIAADQQWRFAPPAALPQKYIDALLVFEDRRFYHHPGIDPLAVGRALWGNFRSQKITSGGSTITMQLARLLGDEPPRTWASKLIEAGRALQLEWRFSKNELLIHYASLAPFGGNIVGLRAASWRYFGRSPEDLSWAESALLAVLPNSPALIHPGRQRHLLQAKRDKLLRRLHQKKFLGDLDLELALLEPLPDQPRALPQQAPHLLETLKQQDPTQAVMHTTLDGRLQKAITSISERHGRRLASEGVNNLAILVMDHHQMDVRAYVGNQAWQESKNSSPHVDIIQRPRSTGSILKPLLYGLMLQEGELLPTTLVPDIPTQYGGFNPQNYDRLYRGAVPAQFALAHSLNVPAVRMLRQYGISRFHHQLKTMGMTSLFRPADDYGLTLILGGAEGTLWELTAIYARLAASARVDDQQFMQPPKLLLSAANDDENKRNSAAKNYPKVIGQGAAWLTLASMLEVIRPGHDALWRDFSSSHHIAWKTGTSFGLRDAWAIGNNGRYTVGIWAGNAGGEAATFLSGQTSAAPVMFDVFDSLGPSSWLAKPEQALKTVSVCVDDGYLAGGQCVAQEISIPVDSHFQQVTPFHRRIHLDEKKQTRVHSRCEVASKMHGVDWFVLPPAQEFFWRQHHSDYRNLPPWRADCIADLAEVDDDQPMDLLYPHAGSRVYIPVDLDGKRSRVVLQAVHRDPQMSLHWHINDKFLGTTRVFHEQTLSLEPGWHQLLLIDQQGHRLQRRFKVLGDSAGEGEG